MTALTCNGIISVWALWWHDIFFSFLQVPKHYWPCKCIMLWSSDVWQQDFKHGNVQFFWLILLQHSICAVKMVCRIWILEYFRILIRANITDKSEIYDKNTVLFLHGAQCSKYSCFTCWETNRKAGKQKV